VVHTCNLSTQEDQDFRLPWATKRDPISKKKSFRILKQFFLLEKTKEGVQDGVELWTLVLRSYFLWFIKLAV
jgi:hypothetical protein